MTLNHHISLTNITPQKICQNGTRTDVTINELPALKGMSLSLLNLSPNGIREPHWHPNAHELSYCLEGSGLMTIFSPGAGHDTFTISPGEIVFVPQGYIHHIENLGPAPLKLLICFNHEAPEDLNLSAGVSSMPNHILAETFGLNKQFFEQLKKNIDGVFISRKIASNGNGQTKNEFIANHFKMNVETEQPQVSTSGGNVKMSNNFLMPALEGLSLYAVSLAKDGAREPHWHPNASELNYLISGKARITLVSPGGRVETFDMQPGDMSFLPQGYLHHIENIGGENGNADEPAHFAIFFNHSAPSDIGFSGCLGAYSNEVLASLFGVSADYFNIMPKYQQDLLVIGGG